MISLRLLFSAAVLLGACQLASGIFLWPSHLGCDSANSALDYEYSSSIVGFANVSKSILFNAKFQISCLGFDGQIFDFGLTFLHLATRIKTNSLPTEQHRRGRKLPVTMAKTVSKTTSRKIVGSRSVPSSEDTWFPLSLEPVRFQQFQNGTIANIFIHKHDHERKSEDHNIKKAIVFIFQQFRNFKNSTEILEDDDIGQHFSHYSSVLQGEQIVLTKKVQPNDFVKMQFDSVNFNQINVFVEQVSNISSHLGHVESSYGTISTQPIAKADQLPIGVVVNYDLNFLKFSNSNSISNSNFNSINDFVKFSKSNFTSQVFDNTANLVAIYDRKTHKFKNFETTLLFEQVWKKPSNPGNLVVEVKGLLRLESQLYFEKIITTRTFYRQIKGPLLKNLELAHKMAHKYKVSVRLLEIAAFCIDPEIDEAFLTFLDAAKISENFARNLLNAVAQLQYPNDLVLSRLLEIESNHHSWPSNWRRETNFHVLLDIGILAGRPSISGWLRAKVTALIVKHIEPFVNNCLAMPYVHLNNLLDISSDILVEDFLKHSATETTTRRLVAMVMTLVKNCKSQDVTADVVRALRHILDDFQVQNGLLDIFKQVTCPERVRIVKVLTTLPDSAYKGKVKLDGTVRQKRSWPKYNFTMVDDYLWTMRSSSHFSCNSLAVYEFFEMKSTSALRLRPRHNGKTRRRRQLEALTGGGGGFDFEFVPEVNCQRWDSNVGYQYVPAVYNSEGLFDRDSLLFGFKKRHCLFNAAFNFGTLGAAGFKAGFFSGQSANGDGRLFGKTWLGLDLILSNEIATVEFSRTQLNGTFEGSVKLSVVGTDYIDEIQYECNTTIDRWTFSIGETLPAFRLVFSGFAFVMNADVQVGVNLTLWPSHCDLEGRMGARFKPTVYFNADAYAELENDYFGVGTVATLSINYFVDFQTQMPNACFYIYHGNDHMFFKFDFYLKLPTFVFINFEPTPVVAKQSYAILTWQFIFKRRARFVIYGLCFPDVSVKPDAVTWIVGDERKDESDINKF